jgi:transposase InsO family protein
VVGKRFLIVDRDAKFSPTFKSILEGSGVEVLLTSYQAPNMNAHAERFVKSIKAECLDQMIFHGRESLVRAIPEYAAHYHEERSHQGIGNELVNGVMPQGEGSIAVKEGLGGLLKYYHRRAA